MVVRAAPDSHFTLAFQVAVGQGRRFEYAGGYWEARAAVASGKGKWADYTVGGLGCPDMYGENKDGAGVYA